MIWDDCNGEDIGTEMAVQDIIYDNGFDDEYRITYAKLVEARFSKGTTAQQTRQFLSNITSKELITIANWMLYNSHGNDRFHLKANYIVQDAMEGRINKLDASRVRCLMGFVREDIFKLPDL